MTSTLIMYQKVREGVGVCGDYRKQGEGGAGGIHLWEGIQASVTVFWKNSKGCTTLTGVKGGKPGLQSVSSAFPVSKSEVVQSAPVTGRFHTSRANTHAHKYTQKNT